MALDPRFMPLISALSGKAADFVSGGMPANVAANAGDVAGGATPQVDAALSNPNTAAAIAGANAPSPAAQRAGNVAGLVAGAESGVVAQPQGQGGTAQPGYGSTPVGQPSGLGSAQGISPEAAAVGAASAQTPAEQGLWDTVMQNLTGRDINGNMLQGQALEDFQRGHTLGGVLGALGAAIGGNSTGGRLGQAVYGQSAGGLAANNAERQQANQNDYLQAALAGLTAAQPQSEAAEQTGPGGPVSQPSRQVYQNMTASTPIGGAASQGSISDVAQQSTMASLEDSLNRMRRLSGI